MTDSQVIKPVLVFAYGNPSRGDDALGPALFEMVQATQQATGAFSDVELLTDFQLQIEHAVDLQQRRLVLFVDASQAAHPPYEFYPLAPQRDTSYTTHAMSPAAVLAVYQQIHHQPPCPAFMLSIRGYEFGLGQALSELARRHLTEAFDLVSELLVNSRRDQWAARLARTS